MTKREVAATLRSADRSKVAGVLRLARGEERDVMQSHALSTREVAEKARVDVERARRALRELLEEGEVVERRERGGPIWRTGKAEIEFCRGGAESARNLLVAVVASGREVVRGGGRKGRR